MKLHEQLARRLGMTRAEIAAVSVLLMLFLLGTAVGGWKNSVPEEKFLNNSPPEQHDALVDSLLAEARKLRETPVTQDTQAPRSGKAPSRSGTSKIEFTTASIEELSSIPGISTVLATRLLEFRDSRNTKIERFDEFSEVKGIGPQRISVLKQHLILP